MEVLADEHGEFRRVTCEGFNGSLQHLWRCDIFPGNIIAGRLRQMAQELALRSAVPFAEGMQRVEFPEVVSGSLAKGLWGEADELFFGGKLPQYRLGRTLNVGVMGGPLVPFADVDGPQMSSPIVHIAK